MSNGIAFPVIRGDSLRFDLIYRADGVAVDLTGCQATIGIKWAAGSLLLESPADIALGADGTIMGLVEGEVTRTFPIGRNTAFQLRLIDSLGDARTILHGVIDVTRSALDEVSTDD